MKFRAKTGDEDATVPEEGKSKVNLDSSDTKVS